MNLEIEISKGSEVVAIGRNTWDPASRSWRNEGGQVVAGKEQEPSSSRRQSPKNARHGRHSDEHCLRIHAAHSRAGGTTV
jgi:hypothetical protein